MIWTYLIVIGGLALFAFSLLFQYRHRKDRSVIKVDLRPAIRIASFDGWASLELQIVNRSDVTVWIEGADLVLTDLDVNFQTALATGQDTHGIRQAIPPHESLSLSLTASLYEAAGRPQGPYSFIVLGTVHYRIGEQWADVNIRSHKIEMTALSVTRLQRVRSSGETPRQLTR